MFEGGRRSIVKPALFVLVPALVAAALLAYRHYARFESTDDAQIDGYIYPVTARVAGHVVRVTVNDHQRVDAGIVLVQLDTRDYEVAVANAEAALAAARAAFEASRVTVPLTAANTAAQLSSALADIDNVRASVAAADYQHQAAVASLRQAHANDLKAQDDVARYAPLAAKDEIPQQQYAQAIDAQKATGAAVAAARASAAAAAEAVTQARARVTQAEAALRYAETRPQQVSIQQAHSTAAHAQVQQAEAALEQARLNLQYATIAAPVSGIVGQRSVQPGEYVAAGQELLSIVPLDSQNIWVTANFKETQLKEVRPGLPVTIRVDTYGRDYSGRVDSIAAATGARYSLLPPENATGNYIKVVQRIPVKILIDQGQDPLHLLRPGMSAVPTVRIR